MKVCFKPYYLGTKLLRFSDLRFMNLNGNGGGSVSRNKASGTKPREVILCSAGGGYYVQVVTSGKSSLERIVDYYAGNFYF